MTAHVEVSDEIVEAALSAASGIANPYEAMKSALAVALPLYDLRRFEADFKAAMARGAGQLTILTHRWRIVGEYGPLEEEYTTEAAAFAELGQHPADAYVQVRTIKEEPWVRAALSVAGDAFAGSASPACCCNDGLLCAMCGTGQHGLCPDNPERDRD